MAREGLFGLMVLVSVCVCMWGGRARGRGVFKHGTDCIFQEFSEISSQLELMEKTRK